MDTSPELVNPSGKFKIGSVEAELALNCAGAVQGAVQGHHLPPGPGKLLRVIGDKYL